jgi:hypothetical protein
MFWVRIHVVRKLAPRLLKFKNKIPRLLNKVKKYALQRINFLIPPSL